MFPLHKSPRGLLELFRLRTQGSNPPRFGGEVVPVVEVGGFYSADLIFASNAAATVGSLANLTTTLTLTADLRCHAVCGELVIGAAAATGVSGHVSLRIVTAGNTISAPLGSQVWAAIPAGGRVGFSAALPYPLMLRAGVALRAVVVGTAAGVDHSLTVSGLFANTLPSA